MGHRDMSNPFMISKIHDQHANNYPPVEQSHLPWMDNGHFVAPMDYGSNPHWNCGGRYKEHHPSFVSMELQQVLGPPVDPYPHSSTSGNTSVAPLGPVGHFHPSHFYDPGMGHNPAGHGRQQQQQQQTQSRQDYAWNFGGGYNEHNPSFVSMEVQQVSGPPVDPHAHSSTVGHFHPSHFYDPGMGHNPAGHGQQQQHTQSVQSGVWGRWNVDGSYSYPHDYAWNFGGRYNEHNPSFVSTEVQQVSGPPVDPYAHSSTVGHFHPSHFYDPGMCHTPAGHEQQHTQSRQSEVCGRWNVDGSYPYPQDYAWNFGGRYNENHPSFGSMEVQQVSGPPVDPYTHSSTIGHFHPSHYYDSSMGHIQAVGHGGPFKRKRTSMFEGSASNFYDAWSSSSSQMPPYRGSSISTDRQTWTRNVRSRSIPEFEPCMIRTHAPSYGSHFHQPTNSHVPVHPVNPSVDVMSQGWNSAPYAASHGWWASPPDINGLRSQTSQFNACHHNPFFQGNLASSSQHRHDSLVQSTEDAYNYNFISVTSNGSDPSDHFSYMNGSRSSTSELHFPSEPTSPGYSSHSEGGGWDHGYRNGRPSMAVPRPSQIVDVIGAHERLEHETLTAGQNSMIFPDQFQDMRLDIADMSYEELLALEERIGNVSTGLPEEGVFEFLSEQVYCSIDRIHEEASCPICLEEYKNEEKVGRVKKCGHNYHVDCIKKWLVMKKECPVCKSECSNQA